MRRTRCLTSDWGPGSSAREMRSSAPSTMSRERRVQTEETRKEMKIRLKRMSSRMLRRGIFIVPSVVVSECAAATLVVS